MMMKTDARMMERALELAANALYDTDPNPAVGCVIVADGQIVGEGWTQPAGGAHAEVVALEAAGAAATGATAYVTFEPCCHEGRTGPCTDALINAGVVRVVYAIDDPNPAVAGRGAQILQDAGLEVLSGPGAAAAGRINAGFISRMQRGRPFVRLKVAASLDGRTALANGTSQWITGERARADVHRWRARSSAVLTGIGTVLADDPQLTARPLDLEHGYLPPLRVIVDSRLRLPREARIYRSSDPVLVVTCMDRDSAADPAPNAEIARVPADASQHCDLRAALALLGQREINDVWVEAGRTLNAALLQADLVDELIVYYAPVVLGEDAQGMFAMGGLTDMAERREFDIADVCQLGRDLRVTLRPSNLASPS